MTALNTSFFFSASNNNDILCSTPKFHAAFLHILLIYGLNLSSFSFITPNIFSSQLFGNFIPSNIKSSFSPPIPKYMKSYFFAFRTIKFSRKQFSIILKSLLSAFLTLSIVLPINYKELLSNVSSGYKNKPFKKPLKSRGPKMDS